MNRNKSVVFSILILLCCGFLVAEPYGTVLYAEGNSFTLIRAGELSVIPVDSSGVFGMEVMAGDVFQTADETMLEFFVYSVGATVKIAENTSFRFDVEPEKKQVTGELYYGRVRAKVERLARGKNYQISSPSLVAGVRGTDFGLDVIALKSPKPQSEENQQEYSGNQSNSVTLHRVFCLEGSVLVGDYSTPKLTTVLLAAGEKVEKLPVVSESETEEDILEKEAINKEIREFWEARPFRGKAPVLMPIADPIIRLDDAANNKEAVSKSPRNQRVPAILTTTFVALGATACIMAAVFDTGGSEDWLVQYSLSAGGIMIGSGVLVSILSLFSR